MYIFNLFFSSFIGEDTQNKISYWSDHKGGGVNSLNHKEKPVLSSKEIMDEKNEPLESRGGVNLFFCVFPSETKEKLLFILNLRLRLCIIDYFIINKYNYNILQ